MYLNRRNLILLSAAGVILSTTAHAQSQPRIYVEGRVAIDGTDPVAYFTEGRPVVGEVGITHEWNGAVWQFSSAANRDAFAANPTAYAPQFGGYCAWAVSRGYTASTVPEAWKIVNGKLYLNYSRRIQRRWERDAPGNIARGNENWPDVLG